MERQRIIVGGFIGLYPTGGVTWDYLQYALGLKMLGHEVYYVEDTMQYSGYQAPGQEWDDATESVTYLSKAMDQFGLTGRWAYRDIGSGKCFGMTSERLDEICRTADVFLNVSASTCLREEYYNIPIRILIDSDPMFTQTQDWDDSDAAYSYEHIRNRYSWYNYLFTFGENIGETDCAIPTLGLNWIKTHQPVCLDYWSKPYAQPAAGPVFTTIMNWSARSELSYNRERYGQKDIEFDKILGVPGQCKFAEFEVVMAVSKDFREAFNGLALHEHGWTVTNPSDKIRSPDRYVEFIHSSSAEFSVAKNAYVKSNSGWFSCRSACYLAAGRPVITQDTGWSKYIETKRGLFSFSDMDSAINCITEVAADWDGHSRAAKEMAHAYFDSNKVLTDMLNRIN